MVEKDTFALLEHDRLANDQAISLMRRAPEHLYHISPMPTRGPCEPSTRFAGAFDSPPPVGGVMTPSP